MKQLPYIPDAAGNLTEKIDAKNQKTVYDYDGAGRLTEIRYFATSDDTGPVKTVTFTYDRAGNLTGYDDDTTSASYNYDDVNRKIGETVNYGPFTLSNGYTYYNNGLKETFTGPDGVTYRYTYDAANQLTGILIPGQGTITYSSYTWNRPDEVILPGGSRRTYEFDPLMRVNSITPKDPGQNVVMSYQYSYDKMDNITAKATEHGPYDYGYDDLYRLTTANNPVQTDETYSYDGVGNRLTSTDHTDWSYNTNNELQGYEGVSFRYDANGNTIEKNDNGNITKYFYNIEDRLARVEDGVGTVIAVYVYDPFGRRLWKEVDDIRTYFVYSDEGLIGEYDSARSEIRSYGYRPGSTWTTDPLFLKKHGLYYFYQNNHLGTPKKITAVNGAMVWNAKYSSFLNATVGPSSTIKNNLRAPGQYYDEETGLHYNYNRYYDLRVGRYLRADPMGLQAGTNLFRYAENNPQVYFDSNGLSGCGPGNFWEYLVPDKPAGYDFLSACNRHDDCYRGDLGCDKTKKDCDDKFLTDMIRLCQGLPIPEVPERPMYKEPGAPGNQVHSKLQCRQTAMVYHFFVTIIGKSNFCSENREKLCGTNPYCHNRKQTHCEPDIGR